jgi:hypothetical protein
VGRSYCEVDTNPFEAFRRVGSGRCCGCCGCRVDPPLVTLRGFPVARAGCFGAVPRIQVIQSAPREDLGKAKGYCPG